MHNPCSYFSFFFYSAISAKIGPNYATHSSNWMLSFSFAYFDIIFGDKGQIIGITHFVVQL